VLLTSLTAELVSFPLNRNRRNPSSWTIQINKREIKDLHSIPRPFNHVEKKNHEENPVRRQYTSLKIFGSRLKEPILLTEEISYEEISGAVRITRSRSGEYYMHVPKKTKFHDLPQLKPQAERKVRLFFQFIYIYNSKTNPLLNSTVTPCAETGDFAGSWRSPVPDGVLTNW